MKNSSGFYPGYGFALAAFASSSRFFVSRRSQSSSLLSFAITVAFAPFGISLVVSVVPRAMIVQRPERPPPEPE